MYNKVMRGVNQRDVAMHDSLTKLCADEFERGIKNLFVNARQIPGTGMSEIPVTGGVFLPWTNYSCLLLRVCAALTARERFRQDALGWPVLPLHEREIEEMEESDCPRAKLVGLFAFSLSSQLWNYDLHPRFDTYVSGLMAYKHAPDEIRNNRALQREFPARALPGLCDGVLYWRNAQQIADDRETLAWMAAAEAGRAP